MVDCVKHQKHQGFGGPCAYCDRERLERKVSRLETKLDSLQTRLDKILEAAWRHCGINFKTGDDEFFQIVNDYAIEKGYGKSIDVESLEPCQECGGPMPHDLKDCDSDSQWQGKLVWADVGPSFSESPTNPNRNCFTLCRIVENDDASIPEEIARDHESQGRYAGKPHPLPGTEPSGPPQTRVITGYDPSVQSIGVEPDTVHERQETCQHAVPLEKHCQSCEDREERYHSI